MKTKGRKRSELDSRRDFLRILGISSAAQLTSYLSPTLMNSVFDGVIAKAHAATSGINPRKYIYLNQPGGPSRWTYDLFLNPFNSNLYSHNAGIGNKYVATNGRYEDVTYATVPLKGLHVPHLWKFDLPRAGGGNRPMSDLLDNLLLIQGVDVGNDAHGLAARLHFKPIGSNRSLPALAGDLSSAPIPSIDISSRGYIYTSRSGKSPVKAQVNHSVSDHSKSNALSELLAAFNPAAAPLTYLEQKRKLDSQLKLALAAIENQAKGKNQVAETLMQNRLEAKRLLEFGLFDLANTNWEPLVIKYMDLIQRTLDKSWVMEGINDLPIGTTDVQARGKQYSTSGDGSTLVDLRNMLVDGTYVDGMAQRFAFTEFVITQNLSSSVCFSTGVLSGLSGGGELSHDEHSAGKMPILYLNSLFYRALSACMLELIDQLKAKNMWSETLLDVGGEFNRKPNSSGSGSEHGSIGSSVALYSGCITGPLVVGNLSQNSHKSAYPGTWGIGAPVAELRRQLVPGDVAVTIAYLLRSEPPFTAFAPLVSFDGNRLVPAIGSTKIV